MTDYACPASGFVPPRAFGVTARRLILHRLTEQPHETIDVPDKLIGFCCGRRQ
jgi:hypothetical protein